MPELFVEFDTKTRCHKKDPLQDMVILHYLRKNEPEEYDAVLREDSRWNVQYHLSPMRMSLINWYPFKENAEVLEIGGAFGELTHILCQKCAYVTCVEREPIRVQGIMQRCRWYSNLDVYQCDFKDFHTDRKYDYILAVGILESQDIASKNPCDYAKIITYLGSFLKQEGKLLVACENRMGIRYLCGAKDGKTGIPFDGVNQYPEEEGLRGFTKQELETILDKAGIFSYKFYYPLPDYKMPQVVYAEKSLPRDSVRDRVIPYYEDKQSLLASELDMLDFCIQSKCLDSLSNSFFVECAMDGVNSEIKSVFLTVDRGIEAAMATIHEGDVMYKEAIYPKGKEILDNMVVHIEDMEAHGIQVVPHRKQTDCRVQMPYLNYPTLMAVLRKAVQENVSLFISLLDQMWKDICRSSDEVAGERNPLRGRCGEDEDWGPILRTLYYDMVPMNCFYIDGEIVYFDQEFVKYDFPAKYTMFRTILYTYINIPEAEKVITKKDVLSRYGISDTMWTIFFNEESFFVSSLRKHDVFHHFHEMSQISFAEMRENARALIYREENEQKTTFINKVSQGIREIQLMLLREFDRICVTNNIQYTLMYGSMLGAVRNQGVIPWDDDVDVAMLRRDYDRLMNLGEDVFQAPFFLQNFKTDGQVFYGGYAKLRYSESCAVELNNLGKEYNAGIWIDIFPLDDYNTEGMSAQVRLQAIRDHQEMIYAQLYGMDFAHWRNIDKDGWKNTIEDAKETDLKVLWERLDGLLRGQYTENIQYVSVLARYQTSDAIRVFPKRWFEEIERVPFEDMLLPVPRQASQCLQLLYGPNYLELPPEWVRRPKHKAIYKIDMSYAIVREMLPLTCASTYAGRTNSLVQRVVILGDLEYAQGYLRQYGMKMMPDLIITDDIMQWGHLYEGIVIDSMEALMACDHVLLIISYERYLNREEELSKMKNLEYIVFL